MQRRQPRSHCSVRGGGTSYRSAVLWRTGFDYTRQSNLSTLAVSSSEISILLNTVKKRLPLPMPCRREFSVSASEVEKFNSMHADWWKPSKNPLIPMNATRVKYMRQQITKQLGGGKENLMHDVLDGIRTLDIGCGGGLLSESLARLGAKVTGIDPSADLLAAAQQHAERTLDSDRVSNLHYRNTTAEELEKETTENSNNETLYDVVCLLEVIEHVRDPDSLLRSAATLLRPGGVLFISTINRTAKSHLMTIIGAEYVMRLLPPGTHDWSLYRSPDEVRQLVETHGLRETDATGMVLEHPPLLSYNWILNPKDTDVNWIGCYVKD